MKFPSSIALLLLSSSQFVWGGGTDGEVTVTEQCNGTELVVTCSWEADARRRLRGGSSTNHRALDMELEEVSCEVTFGDEEYETELNFPYDFMIEVREAEDQDDFCIYSVKGVSFEGIDVTADLTVELKDIDDDAVYDDESLSISGCPSTTRI